MRISDWNSDGCSSDLAVSRKHGPQKEAALSFQENHSMISFKDRVAIVTGAGNGLGRQHALALAARGARLVINDLGGARDGSGGSSSAAQAVVAEIEAGGGEAIANDARSEEHTSELQSLMRISYAVFCLKKKH